MAAPSPTARGTPGGKMLENGFRSLITFARFPTIKFWEKTVKPSGIKTAGDAIDIATMHNVTWAPKAAPALKESTAITGKAAYDPAVKSQIVEAVGIVDTFTVRYPDGTTEAIFGYLESAEFDDLTRNTHPELSYSIMPTNYDPANDVEAGPAIAEVTGT